MFGTFQTSCLRIEVNASDATIRDSLLRSDHLKQWLWPQTFSDGMPSVLSRDSTFMTWLGPIAVQHTVERATDHCLRLLLDQGIDGFHEWHWGDGWVQSRLEGISIVPINAGQTFALVRLKQFLGGLPRDTST